MIGIRTGAIAAALAATLVPAGASATPAVQFDPIMRDALSDRIEFVGHIPRSRAEMHRHLYEEALIILSGGGTIWNETSRARVSPGDVIFFPRKHVHSLQCTADEGMDVVGLIHPGTNPGINY